MNLSTSLSSAGVLSTGAQDAPQIMLYSLFSWGGLSGNITFAHRGDTNTTLVELSLELTDPEETEVTWAIHELPIKYDGRDRCNGLSIGKRWEQSFATSREIYIYQGNLIKLIGLYQDSSFN